MKLCRFIEIFIESAGQSANENAEIVNVYTTMVLAKFKAGVDKQFTRNSCVIEPSMKPLIIMRTAISCV